MVLWGLMAEYSTARLVLQATCQVDRVLISRTGMPAAPIGRLHMISSRRYLLLAPQVQQLLPASVTHSSWHDSSSPRAIKATKPQVQMLKQASVLPGRTVGVNLLTSHAAARLARQHGAEQLIVDQLAKVQTLAAWVPQPAQPQVSTLLGDTQLFQPISQPTHLYDLSKCYF